MRKAFYLLILVLVSQICYSQTILEVRFQDLRTGRAFLVNSITQKKDTINIKDGILSFEGEIDIPSKFQMIVDGYDIRPMNFILSNKKTEVKFASFLKSIESGELKKLYPNKPVFTKDPNHNRLYYEFHESWINFVESIQLLTSENDTEELFEKRRAIYLSFLKKCDSIIQSSSDQFVSAVIINFLLKENLLPLETTQGLYDYLSPSVKNSFYGIEVGEYAGKGGKLAPNNPAPAFELTDLNKQTHKLASLKGKKVLLHFWSSACAPCIKEAPELLKLVEETIEQVITINVSMDTEKDKWLKGIERAAFTDLNNVCDFNGTKGKLAIDYNIKAIPACYLIDEEGRIILKGTLTQVAEKIKKNAP